MTKDQIQLGKTYLVKISGRLVQVKLTKESPHGGWVALNLITKREVRIRTAAKLQAPARCTTCPNCKAYQKAKTQVIQDIQQWPKGHPDRQARVQAFLDSTKLYPCES